MADEPLSPGAVSIPEQSGVLAEPWSIGKLGRMMTLFGPAAIVASVSIGAGETIVVVQAGAWAGYNLLWLVLASVLVKGICATYLLGRYTAVSGELIGHRLVRLPGPRGWLLLAIILLELAAAGPLWAAIAGPSGDLIYYLLQQGATLFGADAASPLGGIPPVTWKSLFATLLILAAIVLGAGATLKSLERQQIMICLILVLGTIVGTLLVWPDFRAALFGMLHVGYVPAVPSWAPEAVRDQPVRLTMTTTFGYVGGSVMCYTAYANWVGIHRWGLNSHANIESIRRRAAAGQPGDYLPNDAHEASRLRRLVAPLRWDVSLGAIVLFIVTASFMMAGAAALYPRLASGEAASMFSGWNLLTDQAHIWREIHPALVAVYYVCVLAALWGTLQSYPEIYSRVTHEFLAAIWPEWPISFGKLQLAICIYVFAASVGLTWSGVQFTTLTNIVAFLTTNMAVALAMLSALWLNFQLPPLYRTRPWMLAAGIVSAVILVTVSVISGWELLR
jgi:Mn2+/Fe2+ NRAMP family transporter